MLEQGRRDHALNVLTELRAATTLSRDVNDIPYPNR
jgi:hypothetical protein